MRATEWVKRKATIMRATEWVKRKAEHALRAAEQAEKLAKITGDLTKIAMEFRAATREVTNDPWATSNWCSFGGVCHPEAVARAVHELVMDGWEAEGRTPGPGWPDEPVETQKTMVWVRDPRCPAKPF